MSYEDHWMDKDKQENDFGFSFQSPAEQQIIDQTSELQERLDQLYRAILPFLDNLSSNPDKDTIYWPNRQEKITAFRQKLFNIKNGR